MTVFAEGFDPVYDDRSRVLILGSFPSVKSRETAFYYGNRQNRFWKTLAEIFGKKLPETIEEKKDFLLRCRVALWDVVAACEVVGSADTSIKDYKVADIRKVTENAPVELIILNGTKAYDIYEKHFGDLGIPAVKLPSTSPANTRFDEKKWSDALSGFAGKT
ncbi:MAG: DNA-deoxyinosine glycosylase [Clostridia bacterium]|nr:DNA-deoxyinosine glycosylase [Clostridia bacterium]